jgi:hypothetical protein
MMYGLNNSALVMSWKLSLLVQKPLQLLSRFKLNALVSVRHFANDLLHFVNDLLQYGRYLAGGSLLPRS